MNLMQKITRLTGGGALLVWGCGSAMLNAPGNWIE